MTCVNCLTSVVIASESILLESKYWVKKQSIKNCDVLIELVVLVLECLALLPLTVISRKSTLIWHNYHTWYKQIFLAWLVEERSAIDQVICGVPFLCYSMSCKTCIIVGNGGILANKSLGQRIDDFDVVVRYVMTQRHYNREHITYCHFFSSFIQGSSIKD